MLKPSVSSVSKGSGGASVKTRYGVTLEEFGYCIGLSLGVLSCLSATLLTVSLPPFVSDDIYK